MSYQTETGRASAGIGGLVRFLIVIAAPLAGFLAASSFEHCGPRLLSMAIGVGLVTLRPGAVPRDHAPRCVRRHRLHDLRHAVCSAGGPAIDHAGLGFKGRAMEVEPRIDLAKVTLAAFALAAVANRFWLHWCSITLADAATGVPVAATMAVAGLRPGINAGLCAIWALWGVLCLAGLFLLRHAGHIGDDVIVALAFCAVLANAAERELTEALPPAPAPRRAQLRALFQTAPAPSWPSSEPRTSSGAARRS